VDYEDVVHKDLEAGMLGASPLPNFTHS
jgi:hypothetical protein